MTQLSEIRVAPTPALAAPPTLARGACRLILRLSNDNPFYVISALLVLLGLWTSFGAQQRNEQAWALMAGLGGYTLLLAVPACLLVRFGAVWEDVRTVLLVVVLMFLATSVTFDETMARDPEFGAGCSLLGLVFAAFISECVLRGMRLNLPKAFKVPYHLALGLFFLFPVALLMLIKSPYSIELEWALYLFAPLAGVVALTLLPAVRRGPGLVRDNGSPWEWPWYPWAPFVLVALAVPARSYLLCFSMQHVARAVPERLIFGPYFLAPFLLAVGTLVLESGIVARSRRVIAAGMALPAVGAVLSGVGHRPDSLYQGFLGEFSARLGATPLYLAVASAVAFYAIAMLRRVPGGGVTLVAALLALAVVDLHSRDASGLVSPRPEPLAAAACVVLVSALRAWSPGRCLLAVALGTAAVLCGPWPAIVGRAAAFHLAMVGVLGVGAAFSGSFARALRTLGALAALGATLAVSLSWIDAGNLTNLSRAYPPLVALLLAAYGIGLRHRTTQVMAALALVGWVVAVGGRGYADLRQTVVGLDAIVLGLVLLALAELISLAKAGLLPRRLPHWPEKPPRAVE